MLCFLDSIRTTVSLQLDLLQSIVSEAVAAASKAKKVVVVWQGGFDQGVQLPSDVSSLQSIGRSFNDNFFYFAPF
jgi:hypothetical protein